MDQNHQLVARSSMAGGKMNAHQTAILKQVCSSPDTKTLANSLQSGSCGLITLILAFSTRSRWKLVEKKKLTGSKVYFQISEKLYFGISVSNKVFQHSWKQHNFTLSDPNTLLFSHTKKKSTWSEMWPRGTLALGVSGSLLQKNISLVAPCSHRTHVPY